ncbi:MAG TPA: CaiB/BaiF CoA-transferase family protein [Terriglobales bacterium]|nr:CaiB/BaiF CoA-transferase family protein [Terriglobales bacterium]
MSDRPLAGIRILAIEQMQALPFATQLLAHLGAEVVKVEHPRDGDSGRAALPAVQDSDGRSVGATYLRNNLNKKSIAVDLKRPAGVELIKRLVPRYDVLGENFKPGTMTRLGLGYADLAAVHPPLVYVSVSGFGNLGASPYASWPAYAPIVEAMAGFYEAKRKPDQPPLVGPAGALGDIGSSLFAAIGLLAALRQRDRTGRGQHVDVAMYDAMVAMADVIPFLWSMGVRGQRRAVGILDGFKAKDGYFVIQAVRDHQLALLADAVGHPEWREDPRFTTRQGWVDQLEQIVRPAIEAWAASRTKHQAAAELCARGLAAGPCHTPEDLVADPHVRAHNMLLEVPRPDAAEPLLITGNPIKFGDIAETASQRWPTLGQHTEEVLRADLDLTPAELDQLRNQGVIG